MNVPFVVERRSARPLQRQIYDQWRAAILGGRFRPGDRVPSSRAFASAYAVARVTVTAAYDQLLAEGYFETRHGAGTFVASDLPDEALRPVGVARHAATGGRTIRLSAHASRLGEITRVAPSPRPLNLSNVSPDLTRFPFPLWRRLVSRQLRRALPALLDHGAQPAGFEPLRHAIASHIARTRAVRCAPSQIIVVSGSQQALDLCARLLLDPGDQAAVEEPGYPGARQLFLAHGVTLTPMRVGASGPAIDRLTARTRLVHVTPSHQFPTGVSMPLARRLELLEWARVQGAVILEDDYDSDYRYSGAPLPAMHSLADDGGVIYIGTFSNVMFRALRIGYLVVPPDLVAAFTAAKWMTDRHTALVEQAALADFIGDGHLDRHIRRMRRLYQRRRDVLLESLDRAFGHDATVRGDAAGLHMTVRFRRALGIRARAERGDVHLASTAIYYTAAPVPDECILGFSAVSERAIRESIRRLAAN
jgi:GntR family transcriptional regulator / MocR family aminotransferase